jgi:hypothetical protein
MVVGLVRFFRIDKYVNGYYMRPRTFFSILIVGLLFSGFSIDRECNRIITTIVDFENVDTIIPIAGCWLSENYLNRINEYKSPKKAQDNSPLIIIPERYNEKTTIMYDFHDNFDYFTIFKNHNKYEIWETHNYLKTKLEFIIEVVSSTKIKIGDTILRKINPLRVNDFYHNGLKNEMLIQEELLFKGIYLTTDGKKVEFKNNGQINGLHDFYYYKPISDYFDEGMQVDQLIMVKSEKDIEWKDLEYYGFKFNSDTLELYKLNCIEFDSTSQNCAEVENGELLYKLWRIE